MMTEVILRLMIRSGHGAAVGARAHPPSARLRAISPRVQRDGRCRRGRVGTRRSIRRQRGRRRLRRRRCERRLLQLLVRLLHWRRMCSGYRRPYVRLGRRGLHRLHWLRRRVRGAGVRASVQREQLQDRLLQVQHVPGRSLGSGVRHGRHRLRRLFGELAGVRERLLHVIDQFGTNAQRPLMH